MSAFSNFAIEKIMQHRYRKGLVIGDTGLVRTLEAHHPAMRIDAFSESQPVEQIPDEHYDYMVVDGLIDADEVRQTILTCYDKVRKGGIIIGNNLFVPSMIHTVAEYLPNFRAKWGSDAWFVERISDTLAYNNVEVPGWDLVFCLSNKCGLTSVKRMILDRMKYAVPRSSGDSRVGLRYVRHEDKRGCTIVRVVRDPVDRFISCYYDKVKGTARPQIALRMLDERKTESCGDQAQEMREKLRKCTLSTFADIVCNMEPKMYDPHFAPQSDTLPEKADFTICLEASNEGWDMLRQSFALPNLPTLNATAHPPINDVKKSMSKKVMDKIVGLYAADYELLQEYYNDPRTGSNNTE